MPTPLPLVFDAPKRSLPPRHLADLDVAGRRAAVVELGEKAFRAEQLSRHYFAGHAPEQMTDLGPAARERLAPLLPPLLDVGPHDRLRRGRDREDAVARPRRHARRVGAHALRRPHHRLREQPGRLRHGVPVLRDRARPGLTRNLSTAEIVEQVVAAQRTESARGGRVSNVVFMGMGEPLANYKRVVDAVRRITEPAPHGIGIGQRSVVVSTVGLVPAIEKLTDEGLQVTLALSLHAPDDELRDTLVPVNTRWPVREVLDAALGYTRRTGRRLSIEYALIRDVNDQPWRADLLAKRLAGKLVHVNLIPLNPTPGSEWDASPKAAEQEFVRRLRAGGVNATVRDTRGREIAGACGQLSAAEA